MGQAADLIQRHIMVPHGTPDPNLRKEPFIRDKGTPVWVVVGYYLGGHSPVQTAAAFALTAEEVQAALDYYTLHQQEIMQRIETSESAVAQPMAQLYLDECVPLSLTPLLAQHGHDVTTAMQLGLRQRNDPFHFKYASTQERILITTNHSDFRLLHRFWITM